MTGSYVSRGLLDTSLSSHWPKRRLLEKWSGACLSLDGVDSLTQLPSRTGRELVSEHNIPWVWPLASWRSCRTGRRLAWLRCHWLQWSKLSYRQSTAKRSDTYIDSTEDSLIANIMSGLCIDVLNVRKWTANLTGFFLCVHDCETRQRKMKVDGKIDFVQPQLEGYSCLHIKSRDVKA